MNVSRNRRLLLAARRYAAHQYLSGQRPVPDWATTSTPYDSAATLRLVSKLANRKMRTCEQKMRNTHCDCVGWWHGEAGCPWHALLASAGFWYDARYAAESRLRPPRLRDPLHPRGHSK